MAKILDQGVGNITVALKAKGIYDSTIQIFSSDNGGPTNHNEGTFSDNFPMRGGKNTMCVQNQRDADIRKRYRVYCFCLDRPAACGVTTESTAATVRSIVLVRSAVCLQLGGRESACWCDSWTWYQATGA